MIMVMINRARPNRFGFFGNELFSRSWEQNTHCNCGNQIAMRSHGLQTLIYRPKYLRCVKLCASSLWYSGSIKLLRIHSTKLSIEFKYFNYVFVLLPVERTNKK